MRPFLNSAIYRRPIAAERVGFEPTVGDYPTLLFESSTLNHSDTSPPGIIPEALRPTNTTPTGKMPMGFRGTPGRIRTSGLLVRNQTLYPLSYGRMLPGGTTNRRMLILAYGALVANSDGLPGTIVRTVQIGCTNPLTAGCHVRMMPRTVFAQPECEG